MLKPMESLWTTMLDLLYPPKCPACQASVAHHGDWCPACRQGVLAPRLLYGQAHHLQYLTECYVVCHYQGGLKRVLHDMKFRGVERYAVSLQQLLQEGTVGPRPFPVAFVPDLVLPVPLHPERRDVRGFDQTELIFHSWIRGRHWSWADNVLVREKNTMAQWRLPLMDRRENIKDAFRITRPELIAGKQILLVDDIFTSGLTMDECAKVLRESGASDVRGMALASGAP